MRNLLLLSCLAVALLATPSYAVVKDIDFVLDSSPITINATILGISLSPQVSNATGTIEANFDYSFDPSTSLAELNKITFTGNGKFYLSDIDYNTLVLDVTSDNMGGKIYTPNPPASVIDTANDQVKNFPTNKHRSVINQGILTINPLIGDTTIMNFNLDPMEGTATGTGTVTTTFVSKSGYDYTFGVVVSMPMSITESGTDPVAYTIAAAGTIVARDQFTQTIIPGDANWDYVVDGSDATILAGYWQYGANMTVPDATWEMGDFNGDKVVDGSDATILAGYWQVSADTSATTLTVPEPGTIALLVSGMLAAGLAFIRRRR